MVVVFSNGMCNRYDDYCFFAAGKYCSFYLQYNINYCICSGSTIEQTYYKGSNPSGTGGGRGIHAGSVETAG